MLGKVGKCFFFIIIFKFSTFTLKYLLLGQTFLLFFFFAYFAFFPVSWNKLLKKVTFVVFFVFFLAALSKSYFWVFVGAVCWGKVAHRPSWPGENKPLNFYCGAFGSAFGFSPGLIIIHSLWASQFKVYIRRALYLQNLYLGIKGGEKRLQRFTSQSSRGWRRENICSFVPSWVLTEEDV